jgi:protein TBF1
LSISEPAHRATIRTTNLATFVSSVFGGQDVGFYELNDHFIETFVADGEELQKEPGMLYLNLKTQMYLSAISQEEQEMTREEVLDDLFPGNLEEMLLARHSGTGLTLDEMEFLKEAKARRDYLQNETGDIDSICKNTRSMLLYDADGISCALRKVRMGRLPEKSKRTPQESI